MSKEREAKGLDGGTCGTSGWGWRDPWKGSSRMHLPSLAPSMQQKHIWGNSFMCYIATTLCVTVTYFVYCAGGLDWGACREGCCWGQ